MIRFLTLCALILCRALNPSLDGHDRNLAIGRAIDVLHHDLPRTLVNPPDLSIFSDQIDLRDPFGTRIRGKEGYARIFKVGRIINQVLLRNLSVVHARFEYDNIGSVLRARVYAQIQPADRVLHVDLMSHYYFNEQGHISAHTIDRLDPIGPTAVRRSVEHIHQVISQSSERTPVLTLACDRSRDHWVAPEVDIYGNVIAPGSDARPAPPKPQPSVLETWKRTIENAAPKPCLTDLDCVDTMQCCDWLFAKICCGGSGMRPLLIPITVQVEPMI